MESSHIKQIKVWTDEETKILLDKYTEYLEDVGPTRKFRNKKDMWQEISQFLDDKNAKQCEERYKTVLKRKKHSAQKRSFDLKQQLEELCDSDDSTELDTLLDVQLTRQINKIKAKKRRKLSNKSTPAEIAMLKEENKERRHKEKMQIARRMCELLEELVDKVD